MNRHNYSYFYENITAGLRQTKYGARLLNLLNRILTLTMYILYPLMIIFLLLSGFQSGGVFGAAGCALPYILVPGISFVLLSAVRNRLNWKRPYEEYDIQPLISKNTKGQSMPSRHVFSSAVIAMAWFPVSATVGTALMIIAAAAAWIRVMGGVHYPSDVAAGLLSGVAAGIFMVIF